MTPDGGAVPSVTTSSWMQLKQKKNKTGLALLGASEWVTYQAQASSHRSSRLMAHACTPILEDYVALMVNYPGPRQQSVQLAKHMQDGRRLLVRAGHGQMLMKYGVVEVPLYIPGKSMQAQLT